MSLSKLQSGRFAEVSLHDHETSESWLIDLADSDAKPVLVAPRETSIRYGVEHHPDAGGGPGCSFSPMPAMPRISRSPGRRSPTAAATIGAMSFAHRPGVYILRFTVFAGWLIRLEREDGLARIVVRRLADGEEHVIAFDEEAYSLGFDAGYEFDTDTLQFSYSSMTTPSEIWDYDLAAPHATAAQAPGDPERA